jgi:2-polyprenyl-6-methoxyphenol hydroxylase-like FAD-dependent oxidoreductase
MDHSTVVVAGAGPTGLMLACELALAGVPVTVLERRPEPNRESAGMAIHGRTIEALGLRGLAERLPAGEVFPWPRTPFAMLWLDLSAVDERDHTFAFPQWRTEDLLLRRSVELGVDIRRGHELVALAPDEHGVTMRVSAAGGEYDLRAEYLAGCDGANSLVLRLAGVRASEEGDPYYGMSADVEPAAGEPSDLSIGLHPGGLFAALPLRPGVLRMMTIEFGVAPPGAEVPVTAQELTDAIHRVTGSPVRLGAVPWLTRYGGRTRLVQQYRSGRVLLAGDAAHSYFISGTQGLNTGIQDAVNLGWKLAAEVNGWAPPGLLDTYHSERHPVGRRACTHARAQLALMHPPELVAPLRELFTELLEFDSVNRHLLQLATDARYELGDPAAVAHPLLGRRVPDAALSTPGGPASVAATLHRGRGVLLHLTDPTPHADRADRVVAAGWPDRVERVRARPTPELDATVLLIRPDGYIAYADRTGTDHDGLQHALTTWFGHPTSPTRAASGALSTAGPDGSRDRPAVAPAGG